MALQPEDETLFQWPPAHWSIAAPEYGSTAPIGPGSPAPVPPPPPPPPQQLGPTPGALPPAGLPPLGPPPIAEIAPPPPIEVADIGAPLPDVPMPEAGAAPIEVQPPAPVEEAPTEPTPDGQFDPLAPQTWDDPLGVEDLQTMLHRDPIGFQQHAQAVQGVKDDFARQETARVAKQNADMAETAARERMDADAKANEVALRVANTRVDAQRWHKTRTPLQGIAGFLAVVIGGLYQARKGGPNIGLEIINQSIDRDIAEQEANIANDRNALAELRAQGLNTFQAKEAYRVAWLQKAAEEVRTAAQDFDPRGATAMNLVQQEAELMARMAQAAEAARRNKLDEMIKIGDFNRKLRESQSEIDKRDAETAKLRGQLGGGGGGPVKLDKQKWTADQLAQMYPGLPVPTDGIARTTSEYDRWLGTQGKGEDLLNKRRDEDRKRASFRVEGIERKDGTPFEFATDKEAGLFRDSYAALRTANTLINDIGKEIKEHGGEADYFKSKSWQKRQSKIGQLDNLLRKIGDMGTLDDGAMKTVKAMRGGVDPTSYMHNAMPGLAAIRDGLLDNMNSKLQVQPGFDGRPLSVGDIGGDDSKLAPPSKTALDKKIERAVGHRVLNTFTDEQKKYVQPGDAIISDRNAAANTAVQNDIAELAKVATGKGEGHDAALKALQAIADKATDKQVKQWATDAVLAVATSSTLSDASKEQK